MRTIKELQEERQRQGMTYDELARRTGSSKYTITTPFREYVKFPSAATMQAVDKALGISDGWTAADRAAGVVERLSVPITADEDEILTLLREVEEKKGAAAREVAQRVVVSVLEEMLK